ncbi:MAG: indolepyruvate oxidoreductase subunit beta [Phycisphaerae bacterium]|nr:indolepyruvate oxidoreductase subunit beta [Phycisphaerae bacterium]
MEHNLILAGVGGQGILTIAQAISIAAVRRGWWVKQAEVHGMSQRGGAVQSHLRIADHELFSELIPKGRVDMILAVEPLEALRYVEFLAPHGSIVASTAPFVNIPNYPPVEDILERVTSYPDHVLVNAEDIAKAAGSVRAANTVMLGAASGLLGISLDELDAALSEMFSAKGASLVQMNQRACRLGRAAATAYQDGLRRGATPLETRRWIDSLSPEQLELDIEAGTAPPIPMGELRLSDAEAQAVAQTLLRAYEEGRRQLYEHEVYRLVELVGAITPPRHQFLQPGESVTAETLAEFSGDRVVLKLVSTKVVHKTEAGAVRFIPRDVDAVNRELRQMAARFGDQDENLAGVLLVEFVERAGSGFGQELFVGIRATREFGAIIAAGLGGVDTEFLAHKMKPGIAVAKALAIDTSPEQFLEMFKSTAAYEILAGKARGHHRVVSDGELLRCFRAFIALARTYCLDRGQEGPDLGELEVNPFAFSGQRMIPLDGRGRLATATPEPPARPIQRIGSMLTPKSIAVLGVSSKRANFGRIILNNVLDCGFAREHAYVIKEGEDAIDGVRCVPDIAHLPEPVDLLVVAASSDDAARLMDEIIRSGKVASAILIPGGMGEREGTEHIEEQVRKAILDSRSRPDGGPIVLGPNCLGVRSHPGSYDTFFIPNEKLDPRRNAVPKRVALISQSGAYIISRMSNLESLDPTLAISLGNQIDLTVSDFLRTVGARGDIDCIGVYVEGFNDLDGLAFVRAVREVTSTGKTIVFYKAGRTAPGRAATAGHTHSVAGDYDICQTAVAHAGAIVTDTFKEFEQLLELSTALHAKEVRGRRIGAISNAGFETVGMADAILGMRYELEIARLSENTIENLSTRLRTLKLEGLINVRNPLDITPMANEDAYQAGIEAMIEDENVDAVVVACVPLTPQLLTTEEELAKPGSLADRLPALLRNAPKPIIAVIDSGRSYDAMARRIREGGVPVFRTCDQAVRSLGRYLCYRTDRMERSAAREQAASAQWVEGVAENPEREAEAASTTT